jgi:Lrp/AsnC family transcriptional regulator
MEFHRRAGEVDYMLKVVVADMRAFDAFYKHLIEQTRLTEVTSRIAMEAIKETTALPINGL